MMLQKEQTKFNVDYTSMFKTMLETKGTISKCYSIFHNYSINNQFLAYWQLSMRGLGLSPIATYKKWESLGRQVQKGQKAMFLWQPRTKVWYTEDENKEQVKHVQIIGFDMPKKWFAMSQTEGKDIDIENIKIKNFNFDKIYKKFGIEIIPFEKLNGNVQGYAITSEKKLAINPIAQHPEMTILHEVAHIVLKHCDVKYSRDLKELEAEATAYIIGSVLGLDDEQLSDSRGYIQNWFTENEIPEQQAQNIMSAADKILKAGLEK